MIKKQGEIEPILRKLDAQKLCTGRGFVYSKYEPVGSYIDMIFTYVHQMLTNFGGSLYHHQEVNVASPKKQSRNERIHAAAYEQFQKLTYHFCGKMSLILIPFPILSCFCSVEAAHTYILVLRSSAGNV